ncbi:MAG: 2'-5' RNA ligase family protein [bacterium]|nr:2'-5' RNA ligase family protein [bacterium]
MVPADKCALIVPLDVEPQSLAAFRARHILTPAVSLPAHVTLRVPLPPLHLLDTEGLSDWAGRVRGFDFELSATERFEGAGVIYLVPDPAQRFRELALELTALYPDPPSPFSEPVMHVTAAEGHPVDQLSRIERELLVEVAADLPIRARAEEVRLYEKSEGTWYLRQRYPFA